MEGAARQGHPGKQVVIAQPSLKRHRKGPNGASSSIAKAGPTKRFREKVVEPHGLTWFNSQKEAKYAPENWIDGGPLALEFRPSKISSLSWELDTSLLSQRSATSH
ncbi:hypothetical protein HAX54_020197 [Datura stramonium]|uniref:Uncharacterized protein n=1 Tax=Datura stramonium TaxID=4076 RepID=A0ABS8USM4_DATST|nr:hypothetical protein [Datura stramonium]